MAYRLLTLCAVALIGSSCHWIAPYGEASATDAGPGPDGGGGDTAVVCADGGLCDLPAALAVSSGHHFSCAVFDDGSVRCWGAGDEGQLGLGDRSDRAEPTLVQVRADEVAVGGNHACALGGGAVHCWGGNWLGQAGAVGDPSPILTPRALPDPANAAGRYEALALGDSHSCALDTEGKVWCWGGNGARQLGGGAADDLAHPSPTEVALGPDIRARQLDCGAAHCCAVVDGGAVDNAVVCWGANTAGQVDPAGSFMPSGVVTPAIAADLQVERVAAGSAFTCVIHGGVQRELLCWGEGSVGQLGVFTSDSSASPSLPFVPSDLALGHQHACALDEGGALVCWGANRFGQAGQGNDHLHDAAALAPLDLGAQLAAQASCGSYHCCAVTDTGRIACWGRNVSGAVGSGTMDRIAQPRQVLAAGTGTFALGLHHSCALENDTLICWGGAARGESGIPRGEQSFAAPTSMGPLFPANSRHLALGGRHGCLWNGELFCWGDNWAGQAGTLTPGQGHVATLHSKWPSAMGVQGLAAGWQHTCALTDTGEVHCWGGNTFSQLADSIANTPSTSEPKLAFGGLVAEGLDAERHTTCVRTDSEVFCWGANERGQADPSDPTPILDDPTQPFFNTEILVVRDVAVGNKHACAVVDLSDGSSGRVLCWGDNGSGQLGRAAGGGHKADWVQYFGGELINAASVVAGVDFTCALMVDGAVLCWGDNLASEHGSERSFSAAPIQHPMIVGAEALEAGGRHLCARFGGGELLCWGETSLGQVGKGGGAWRKPTTIWPASGS